MLVTGTPRVNRCGSRISRSDEKLFECPLCGVAERNRRFSKRGATSRTTFVIRLSIAYLLAVAGAAVCASSSTSKLFRARSPMCESNGSRYSGRRISGYEMMKRWCVLQGFTPKPRSCRRRATKARLYSSK